MGNHRSSPAASPGIRRYAPPSTSFRFRARQRCRRRDVSGCHSRDRAAHVVLHHLSGLPSPKVAGVLQPAADPGVRRVSVRAALSPDESGGRAHRHPRDAVRTPRRIPSPIAAPRHRGRCTSCGSTDLRAPPDRFRSRTETPDAPADPMGSGRPIARPTSTHPPGGLPRRPKSPRTSPRHRSGPLVRPRAVSPTLAGESNGTSARPGRVGRFRALLHRRVRAVRSGLDTGNDASTILPGLRSPSRSTCLTLAGETDAATAEAGGGIELRSVVLSTRAVHAVTRTTRRQAWQAEDTGKPVPRPDMDPCGSCPPDPALAGPGTESLRGFTRAPLARRPGAPGVCPEPEWARRVHRSPPGLTRAGSDGRVRRPSWGS
jgi:hypothetical protein